MNFVNLDIVTDKLNATSQAFIKRKYYWITFKNRILRLFRHVSECISMEKEELYEYERNKIYSRLYNVLNLYEAERSNEFVNENKWIMKQCKQQIGPVPEDEPEKELIKSALDALYRQRLIIATDRLYYKPPKIQPPPRIPTVWKAPLAIVCKCPQHECRCIMRKTATTADKAIPQGKRFWHKPFSKTSPPPPGLILTVLAERIKNETQVYSNTKNKKKLGVEICMSGCMNYMAGSFMLDPQDKNALKELKKAHKMAKKKKVPLKDGDKIRKKKKGKKVKENEPAKPGPDEGQTGEETAEEVGPETAIEEGAETAAEVGAETAAEVGAETGAKVESGAEAETGTETETRAKEKTSAKDIEKGKDEQPQVTVPKKVVICNMFYNTVATQTERDENDELIIGSYLHIIFACPEETTLCDIEGMKVGIKPYDPTEPRESNMEKLFHVSELKEHISKIKTVLYDPMFEIVQEKLINRSFCGSVSLGDFIESIEDVTKRRRSSFSRKLSQSTLDDDEEDDVTAEIYLPWISLEKLSRLRDSFLKYVRGDVINEDEINKYVDLEPGTCKGCLPPELINDEPTEGKLTEHESETCECCSIHKDDEENITCKGDIPFKIDDDELNQKLKLDQKKDDTSSCKFCMSPNLKSPVQSMDTDTFKDAEIDNDLNTKHKGNTNAFEMEINTKNNEKTNAFEKTDNQNQKGNKRSSFFKNLSSGSQLKVSTPKDSRKSMVKTKNNKKKSASGSEIKKVSEKKSSAKFSVSFGEFKEKIFHRDPWRPCIPTESEIDYRKELKRRRAKKTGNVCECEEEEDTCWNSKKPEVNSGNDVQKDGTSYDSTKGILKRPSKNKSESKEFEDNKFVGYCSDVVDLKNSSEFEMITHNMEDNISGGNSFFSNSKTLMRLAIHKLKYW